MLEISAQKLLNYSQRKTPQNEKTIIINTYINSIKCTGKR